MRFVVTFFGLLLGASALAGEGFEPLFSGRNLDGWTGDTDLWSVADGVIVGSTDAKQIESNSFLSTKKTYKNFTLKARFKLRNGNSGVQFRSQQFENHRVTGYQADIADARYMGVLYEEGGRGILADVKSEEVEKYLRKDDWNEYVITVDGKHITLQLNGYTTADYTETSDQAPAEGVIALQIHVGPKMRIEFQTVEIKELP